MHKKIFLTLFALLYALCAHCEIGDVVLQDFEQGALNVLNRSSVEFSEDLSEAAINTRGTKSEWNPVFGTNDGFLKPATPYILRFKYKMLSADGDDAYLHVIVRKKGDAYGKADIAAANFKNTSQWNTARLAFKVPAGETEYALQFHTNRGLEMEIAGFSITEDDLEGFIAVEKNAKPSSGKFENLPTGAKEFTVEQPKPASALVVKAEDFGATEDNPNFAAALNKAIAHAKKEGAAKLVLKKGVYHVNENVSVKFDGMKDFEFDGGGSTFVYFKTSAANMMVSNCERTLIGNFNWDWEWEKDPLASIVEVAEVNAEAEKPYIDLKFTEYDNFPRKDVRVTLLSCYDPKTKSVGIEGGFTMGFEFNKGTNKPETEWLSGNVLRVYMTKDKAVKYATKQLYRMQHYYYDMHGMIMESNTHLTLKDINIYSCAGHAMVVKGAQQYWQFLNVNIEAPEGAPRRAITCTADHCHIANSKGFFKMENCRFSLGADDCLNIHDCSGFARKTGDFTLQTQNAKNLDAYKIGDKLELRQGDYSPSGYTGTIEKVDTLDGKAGVHVITFAEKLPEQKSDGFIMFNHKYNSNNVILRNCRFGNNRARGVLILGRDVTIENCVFFHSEMGAIKIETGYTFNTWSEGFGVDNVVIRNNVFESSNPLDVKNFGRSRDIYMGTYMRTDPSEEQTMYPILKNILIEKNTFKNTYGLIASINSTGSVTIRDNVFINDDPRQNPFDYRACFYVNHSTDTKIVNNTYVSSPLVPKPGVYFDRESVKGLVFEGNRIVEKSPQK